MIKRFLKLRFEKFLIKFRFERSPFFNRTSNKVPTSRSMVLGMTDQNQGSGSRSQLATLTRSHEWMRPGRDPSSQRNQHSNHSAPDAPTSTTWACYTLLMHLLYPWSDSEGGGSDNSLTCLDFRQPQALWFEIEFFFHLFWLDKSYPDTFNLIGFMSFTWLCLAEWLALAPAPYPVINAESN